MVMDRAVNAAFRNKHVGSSPTDGARFPNGVFASTYSVYPLWATANPIRY